MSFMHHKHLYKQHLNVKNYKKKFLNSIKLLLLFNTEISSTEYRNVAYVQYRDVLIPFGVCRKLSHLNAFL